LSSRAQACTRACWSASPLHAVAADLARLQADRYAAAPTNAGCAVRRASTLSVLSSATSVDAVLGALIAPANVNALYAETVIAAFERLVALDQPALIREAAYVTGLRPKVVVAVRRVSFKLDVEGYERILAACVALGEDDTALHSCLAEAFLWSTRLGKLEHAPMRVFVDLLRHGVEAGADGGQEDTPEELRLSAAVRRQQRSVAVHLRGIAGPRLSQAAALALVRRCSDPGIDSVLWCRTPELARTFRRLGLMVQHRLQDAAQSSRMRTVRLGELRDLVHASQAVVEHELLSEARVGAQEEKVGMEVGVEGGGYAPVKSLPTVAMAARVLHLCIAYTASHLPRDVSLREFWTSRATVASAGASSSSSGSDSDGESRAGVEPAAKHHPRALAVHLPTALPVLLGGIMAVMRYGLVETGTSYKDANAGLANSSLVDPEGNAVAAFAGLAHATSTHYSGVKATSSYVRKHWLASRAEGEPGLLGARRLSGPPDALAAASVGAPHGADTHPKYRALFASLRAIPACTGALTTAARELDVEGALPQLAGPTYAALVALLSSFGGSPSTQAPDVMEAACAATVRVSGAAAAVDDIVALSDGYDLLQSLNVALGVITPEEAALMRAGEGEAVVSRLIEGSGESLVLKKPHRAFRALVVAALAHHAPSEAWSRGRQDAVPGQWGAPLSPADAGRLLAAALRAGLPCSESVPPVRGLGPREAGLELAAAAASGGAEGVPLGILAVNSMVARGGGAGPAAASCVSMLLQEGALFLPIGGRRGGVALDALCLLEATLQGTAAAPAPLLWSSLEECEAVLQHASVACAALPASPFAGERAATLLRLARGAMRAHSVCLLRGGSTGEDGAAAATLRAAAAPLRALLMSAAEGSRACPAVEKERMEALRVWGELVRSAGGLARASHLAGSVEGMERLAKAA